MLGTADILPEMCTPARTWDSICKNRGSKKVNVLALNMCSNMILKLFSQKKALALHPRSQVNRIFNYADFKNLGTLKYIMS